MVAVKKIELTQAECIYLTHILMERLKIDVPFHIQLNTAVLTSHIKPHELCRKLIDMGERAK